MKNYNVSLNMDIKTDIYPIVIHFKDNVTKYDFSIYSDTIITRLFAKAFQNRYTQFTKNSRNAAFYHIKIFFDFFNKYYKHEIESISREMLAHFSKELDNNKNYSLKTKYRYYNNVEVFLKEIIKFTDSPLKNFNLPTCPFIKVHTESKDKNKISAEEIQVLLKICYSKIDESINKFRLGQIFIQNYNFNSLPISNKVEEVVSYFYYKYGHMPSMEPPHVTTSEAKIVYNTGGVSEISKYLHPTKESLLPFYLVLIIELAGNSDAIKNMNVNCIREDLIFDDRVLIEWNKPRANQMQRRNVLKKKKYGAYQIIQYIKEITSLIRPLVKEEARENLFICRGGTTANILSTPNVTGFQAQLKIFIKDNDLKFDFNLEDLRPSILTEIYRLRKNIVSVAKIANHANINTTLSYIVDKETKKENAIYLSGKQDKLIDNIIKYNNNKAPTSLDSIDNVTNIGFNCKNPVIENKICINWMAELTNPNLIIPDSPNYLAKILKLEKNIKEQKDYVSIDKFELLYQPVLEVIKQILPNFSKAIKNEALKLIKEVNLPNLKDY